MGHLGVGIGGDGGAGRVDRRAVLAEGGRGGAPGEVGADAHRRQAVPHTVDPLPLESGHERPIEHAAGLACCRCRCVRVVGIERTVGDVDPRHGIEHVDGDRGVELVGAEGGAHDLLGATGGGGPSQLVHGATQRGLPGPRERLAPHGVTELGAAGRSLGHRQRGQHPLRQCPAEGSTVEQLGTDDEAHRTRQLGPHPHGVSLPARDADRAVYGVLTTAPSRFLR